jgi:hypothetical protein
LAEYVLGRRDCAPLGVLRVLLDEEPLPGGVEFRGELAGDAEDGDDSGVEVDVALAEFDELAPTEPGFDVGLDEQLQLLGGDGVIEGAELVGVMIRLRLVATVGVFTPMQGCRKVIWSLNAVLKMAERTVMA